MVFFVKHNPYDMQKLEKVFTNISIHNMLGKIETIET